MKDIFTGLLGIVILIAGCLFIGFQLKAAYLGYGYHIGLWPFVVTLLLCFFLPPLGGIGVMLGSFLGAYSVWEWPWYGSLLWACPITLIMVPAIFMVVKETYLRKK